MHWVTWFLVMFKVLMIWTAVNYFFDCDVIAIPDSTTV